jgi:hypothetical protein
MDSTVSGRLPLVFTTLGARRSRIDHRNLQRAGEDQAQVAFAGVDCVGAHRFGTGLRQLRRQRCLSQRGPSRSSRHQSHRRPPTTPALRPCRGWTLGRLARAVSEDPTTMILPRRR